MYQGEGCCSAFVFGWEKTRQDFISLNNFRCLVITVAQKDALTPTTHFVILCSMFPCTQQSQKKQKTNNKAITASPLPPPASTSSDL